MASATENRYINVYINGKQVGNTPKEIGAAYSKLRNEIAKTTVGSKEYIEKVRQLNALKGHLDAHNNAVRGISRQWEMAKTMILSVVGGNLITSAFQKVVSFFPSIIKGAAETEDQLADIRKATEMTADEVENLSDKINTIDTRTSKKELLDMAKVAGQLGIVKNDVFGFVESVDKLNVALGDEFTGGAEQVATEMGTLRNIFTDIKSDKIDEDLLRIGNAINELGAKGFATGPVITDYSNRIGGVGITLGLTSGQVLGMSAALQELNVDAERGGTAVTKVLQKMTSDTKKFAQIAGMSVSEFEDLLNKDLYGAFKKVLAGTRQNATSATEFSAVLEDLGLKGSGASEVFSKLNENVELMDEKVTLANESLSNTNSITNEFNIKNNTLGARLDKLGKMFHSLFTSKPVKDFAKAVVEMLINIAEWMKRNVETLKVLGKILVIVLQTYLTFKVVNKIIEGIVVRWVAMNAAITKGGGVINTFSTKIKGLWATVVANPLGALITALGVAFTAMELFGGAAESTADKLERLQKSGEEDVEFLQKLADKMNQEMDNIEKRYDRKAEIAESEGKQAKELMEIELEKLGLQKMTIEKQMAMTDQYISNSEKKIETLKTKIDRYAQMIGDHQKGFMADARDRFIDEKQIAEQLLANEIKTLQFATQFKTEQLDKLDEKQTKVTANENKLKKGAAEFGMDQKKKEVDYQIEQLRKLNDELEKFAIDLSREQLSAYDREILETEEKYQKLLNDADKSINELQKLAEKGDNVAIVKIKAFEQQKLFIKDQAKKELIQLHKKYADEEQKVTEEQNKEEAEAKIGAHQQINDALADENQRQRQEIINHYQKLIDLAEKYGGDVVALRAKMLEELAKLDKDHNKKELLGWQKNLGHITDSVEDFWGPVKDMWSSFHGFRSQQEDEILQMVKRNQDEDLAYLQSSLDKKMLTEEEYQKMVDDVNRHAAQREREIKKEQWRRERSARAIESTINTSVAVTKALSSAPPPVNFILAGIVGTKGALETSFILKQPVPEFKKGGFAPSGASHLNGGISLVDGRSGKKVGEMEGGEPILSKSTYLNNAGLINRLMASNGKRISYSDMLSDSPRMNFSSASKNIHFDKGGISPSPVSPIMIPVHNENGKTSQILLEILDGIIIMNKKLDLFPREIEAKVVYKNYEKFTSGLNSAENSSIIGKS